MIHEEMVVTGKVHNMRQLGPFIYRLCNGKDTYRLSRRVTHRRESGSKFDGGCGSEFNFTRQILKCQTNPAFKLAVRKMLRTFLGTKESPFSNSKSTVTTEPAREKMEPWMYLKNWKPDFQFGIASIFFYWWPFEVLQPKPNDCHFHWTPIEHNRLHL